MLILDIKAQHQIRRLIERAAERPLTRVAVEQQIAQLRVGKNVNLDPSLCVAMVEDYLAMFCFEAAPGMGLARHLAVSRGTTTQSPHRVAIEMLKREFGITTRTSALVCWLQTVPGRGRAVHLLEPVTALNSIGLPPALQAAVLAEDELLVASDEEIEEEAA